MSRQRRFMLILTGLGAITGASIGYALEGVGLAVVEFAASAVGGALAFKFTPWVAPPKPDSIPSPVLGSSPEAVRWRQNQRVGVLVSTLPLAVLLSVVAFVADPLAAQLAAAAGVALLLAWVALSLWILSGRSAFWDRVRVRIYERAVATASRERQLYEDADVDPARERRRLARFGRGIAAMHLTWLAIGLMIVPGVIAAESSSPALRTAGAVLSALLFLLFAVGLARWLQRRPSKPSGP